MSLLKLRYILFLPFFAFLFLNAKNFINNSSTTVKNESSILSDYNISITDDEIVGAKLIATAYVNINGVKYKFSVCNNSTNIGSGKYILNNCSQKPDYIFSYGGFIDSNHNSRHDSKESTQYAPLILNMSTKSSQQNSNSQTITAITTLISESNTKTINTFMNKMGYNPSDSSSSSSFFAINDDNKVLRNTLNTIFNSCVENGIDIEKFNPNLILLINTSKYDGINAIKDAISIIISNPTVYEKKYGKSQIHSFLNDRKIQSILRSDDPIILTEKVPFNKLRILGFVNTYLKGDNIINTATVNMYINTKTLPIATVQTDQNGKYSFDINQTLLPKGVFLILVAHKNGIKLTSSIKSDAILDRQINNMVNPIILPDLTINYVTTLVASRINSMQAGTTSPKLVFDGTTGYTEKNKDNETTFIPIPILYEQRVLPWGPDVELNTTFLTKYSNSLPPSSVPYVLDVESYNFGNSSESNDVTLAKMAKYFTIIDTMKASRPDLKFGYFGLLPQLSLLQSSFNSDHTYQSHVLNRINSRYNLTKKLANHVDVLFPELYTYWPESKSYAYTNRVDTGINIYAVKYNKPIIPFLCPFYSPGIRDTPGGEYLSNSYWALEFSTLWKNNNVNGIAIWGGRDYRIPSHPTRKWDENLYWWQYTKQYIQ